MRRDFNRDRGDRGFDRPRFGGGGGRFGGGGRGGFGGGGFRDDMPKPVKVGEEYDVTIEEIAAKGDGIAKVKNFVVFVPETKKGDHVKIKIKEVARKFAIAEKVGESEGSEEPEEKKEAGEESEEEYQEYEEDEE